MYIPTLIPEFYQKPINLDITNRCALQCPACTRQTEWYKKDRNLYKDMSTSDLLKFIKTFKNIEFCGQQSDPLCHPKILEFISMCKNNRLDIHTATSHNNKDFYEEAFSINPKVKWIFGLDGLPKDSHKHRVNQDGVHLFEMMKLGVKMGIYVIWQYIVFNYNQNSIKEAEKLSRKEGIRLRLSFSSRWHDDDLYTMHLKPEEKYCA